MASSVGHDTIALSSSSDNDLGPKAFLSPPGPALHMARFPEAERRRLHKMICMRFLSPD